METRTQGPAIGLMVTSGLSILWCLFWLFGRGLLLGMMGAFGGMRNAGGMLQGALGVVISLIGIAIYIFVFFAATKMRSMESYGIAIAGAICSFLPCSCCFWIPNIAMGIWALVVLLNADVKAAFQS
ncbi:MAG: hypothetical protein U0166_25335 [Acidobacteriota bacterium]